MRYFPTLLLVVGLLPCGNCDAPTVVKTHVVVSMPLQGSGFSCLSPQVEGDPSTGVEVSVFLIDVMAYNGPAEPADQVFVASSLCRECFTEGNSGAVPRCERLSRQCFCGGPRDNGPAFLNALSDLEIRHVPDDRPLCVRVIALSSENAQGPEEGPAQACPSNLPECSWEWEEGAPAESQAELCLVSDLTALSNGDNPILIRDGTCDEIDNMLCICTWDDEYCPDDVRMAYEFHSGLTEFCPCDDRAAAVACAEALFLPNLGPGWGVLMDVLCPVLGLCQTQSGFNMATCAAPVPEYTPR